MQSAIGDTYAQAQKDLLDGKEVLFSGTPCQIAGLKQYLKKDYENLLTVDIICHGVPSKRFSRALWKTTGRNWAEQSPSFISGTRAKGRA